MAPEAPGEEEPQAHWIERAVSSRSGRAGPGPEAEAGWPAAHSKVVVPT